MNQWSQWKWGVLNFTADEVHVTFSATYPELGMVHLNRTKTVSGNRYGSALGDLTIVLKTEADEGPVTSVYLVNRIDGSKHYGVRYRTWLTNGT